MAPEGLNGAGGMGGSTPARKTRVRAYRRVLDAEPPITEGLVPGVPWPLAEVLGCEGISEKRTCERADVANGARARHDKNGSPCMNDLGAFDGLQPTAPGRAPDAAILATTQLVVAARGRRNGCRCGHTLRMRYHRVGCEWCSLQDCAHARGSCHRHCLDPIPLLSRFRGKLE